MKFYVKSAIVLCIVLISTLFTISALEFINPTSASTAPALHVSGNQIQDVNGKTVYLRGIGRAGDIESASGMWSGPDQTVFAWDQKWYPISSNIELMDATFKCYQETWKSNMIRVFVNVNWYWQNNITASIEDPDNYPAWTTPISYQNYVTTVVSEAAKYGIYVDVCPYQLTSGYENGNGGGAQGMPLCGWDEAGTSFLSSTKLPEQTFWSQFWTLMASNLKDYPNAIFEAWNEPQNTGTDPITPEYLTYLTTMYNAVRSVTSQNLIFMQWNAGYIPNYNDLSWCQQISNAIPNAANLVYTTHAYRHSPYFNYQWETNTPNVQSQLTFAIESMGIKAPLLVNEAASCKSYVPSSDVQNELGWWRALNNATRNLGIGLTAYYWMSDNDLGPVFEGEALLTGYWVNGTSSPMPNQMGEIFLTYSK